MNVKSRYREWLREATGCDQEPAKGEDTQEQGDESRREAWDRVYHPFVNTLQEWIDLNA